MEIALCIWYHLHKGSHVRKNRLTSALVVRPAFACSRYTGNVWKDERNGVAYITPFTQWFAEICTSNCLNSLIRWGKREEAFLERNVRFYSILYWNDANCSRSDSDQLLLLLTVIYLCFCWRMLKVWLRFESRNSNYLNHRTEMKHKWNWNL